MNREIEFRGKRKDNNEWVYGYYLKTIKDSKSYIYNDDYSELVSITNGIETYEPSRYNMQIVETIPETIGQYTGLKDKNGKKIFEGDIVRLDDDYRKLISAASAKTEEELCRKDCLVGYKDGSFMFGRNRYFMNELDSYLWLSNRYCEVIGTIFDKENNNEPR